MDLEFNRKVRHFSFKKLRCLNSERYLAYFSYFFSALLAIRSRVAGTVCKLILPLEGKLCYLSIEFHIQVNSYRTLRFSVMIYLT